MALLDFIQTPSPIHRIDPRTRIVVCVLLAAVVAAGRDPGMLGGALAASLLLALGLKIPGTVLRRRLLLVNVFAAMLWITVPLSMRDGTAHAVAAAALAATLKANAITLLVTSLVSTIEVVTLGHALAHLHLPRKLVHLLLFTVRYTEVLHLEHERLARAMRARCFVPGTNRRTYRALATLAGMLLVRSLDRSDRVLAAMKCRGFRGQFYLLHHFHFHRLDAWFGLAGVAVMVMLATWEWL